jgi:hypothetical protein
MKYIFTIVLTMILLPFFSQEGENFSCKCCNTNLKLLLEGKSVDKIYVHGCNGTGSSNMATSFLMPSGTPPKPVVATDEAPDYSEIEKWTCRYAPGLVTDGDEKTAWVEGSNDYGVGELIIVACLDLKKPLQIWAGYGKSPAIFTQNSRPKKIKTMIIRGDNPSPSQYGTWYNNLTVIKQSEVALKDLNGFQSLSIPSYDISKYVDSNQNEMEYNYFLGIVIMDVYKGTKYSDTCISEIKN